MSFDDNVKKRYAVLEWIDTIANKDGDVLLKASTFAPQDIDPALIAIWLQDLHEKGLVQVFERTRNDWFSFKIKNPDFHKYVDEVYRWLQLSVDKLSIKNFLAVLDVAHELRQKFEVTQSNTVTIGEKANTKMFPQLIDDNIDYRAGALQFLKEYGVIDEMKYDGWALYEIAVTRRFFDKTYQTILTRAVQEGYATYKNDKVVTKAIADESRRRQQATKPAEDKPISPAADRLNEPKEQIPKPLTKNVEIQKLRPNHYSGRTGILSLSPDCDIDIAKRGKVKRANGKKYDQCWLLECLFKSVNTLKLGVNFSTVLGVNNTKIGKKEVKKIRNTVDEINQKVIDKGGPKRLIYIQGSKVFINKSYLI